MLSKPIFVEALMQTPEQRLEGTVTFRAYLDDAWRNVQGLSEWKYLTPAQQAELVEEVYRQNKSKISG
ncbi:MAG: hypothetical protein ABI687_02760 [Flavitalea sp.]